jgi:DNA-binding MarR family transcriptional regulator
MTSAGPDPALRIPSHAPSRGLARDGPSPAVAQATLDRILELFERRGLAATELRVLLALLDRGALLSELAEALDQRPNKITRAGRSLSMRGLTRWHHAGRRKETRLEITSSGLTTVRALLTAAGAPAADAGRPEAAVRMKEAA